MSLVVRFLTAEDLPALQRLYQRDSLRFLTSRMNLECYGFSGQTVRAWGAFTPDGAEVAGILLRYSNTAIVADLGGVAAADFAAIIDKEAGLAGVRGTLETVRKVRAALHQYTANGMEQSQFMQLRVPPLCPPETLRLARRARMEDLDKLSTLYAGAYSMFRSRDNVASKLAQTRVFVVEEPAGARQPLRIAACALLNMEGQDAGLIGGVFTHPGARGRGYAAACTAALSLDLQRDNKLPCLFYENPVAGRVYRRLGFEEAGQWAVLYLNGAKLGDEMYLSIRDEIVFMAGYKTLAEGLRDLNIAGVELWVRRDNTVPALVSESGSERFSLTEDSDLEALQAQAQVHGIRIAALCMGNNFNADDKAAEIAWAVRAVHAAHRLGAPAVRIDTIMSGEKDLPLPERQRLVAHAVTQILEQTDTTDVDLGIENHGFQGNDPEFIQGLLGLVNAPRLGLTLDSGNFYWRGWPLSRVYEIFAQLAPVVKHTHIKNIAYPPELREVQREMGYEYGKYVCPIHEGDIDHTLYITLLGQAGYARDICLEDESVGKYSVPERKANLRAAADFFRPYLAE